MRTVVSGASFIEFKEVGQSFSGKFLRPLLREKDGKGINGEVIPAGTVMGYIFENVDGEEQIVGASHQIEKALTAEGEGVGNYYKVTFGGKGQTADKKPFNKFHVEAYDNEAEFKLHLTGEVVAPIQEQLDAQDKAKKSAKK